MRFWGHTFTRTRDELLSALEVFTSEMQFRLAHFDRKVDVLRDGARILHGLAREMERLAEEEEGSNE